VSNILIKIHSAKYYDEWGAIIYYVIKCTIDGRPENLRYYTSDIKKYIGKIIVGNVYTSSFMAKSEHMSFKHLSKIVRLSNAMDVFLSRRSLGV